MRILSDEDVASVLDLETLLPVVERAFVKQGRGEVERPDRPHFPVGTGLQGPDPLGTGLVMPAYVHGSPYYATKLVGVHEGNEETGLPTVNAQIALTNAETGLPVAFLSGTRLTNARTGCIGGLAAKYLAVRESETGDDGGDDDAADGDEVDGGDGHDGGAEIGRGFGGDVAESGGIDEAGVGVRLGIIGAGTQARWQARAIAAATGVEWVKVYSPSDSREACAADLRDAGLDATAVDSPRGAVEGASVVVTATTATTPVFPGDALSASALVVAVGAYTSEMRELDDETVSRAARVFADVPEEVAATGDFPALTAEEMTPLSSVFDGQAGRTSAQEVIVVGSVGTAVLDAAAAADVYDLARETGVGETVNF